jgi:hypothetical protein
MDQEVPRGDRLDLELRRGGRVEARVPRRVEARRKAGLVDGGEPRDGARGEALREASLHELDVPREPEAVVVLVVGEGPDRGRRVRPEAHGAGTVCARVEMDRALEHAVGVCECEHELSCRLLRCELEFESILGHRPAAGEEESADLRAGQVAEDQRPRRLRPVPDPGRVSVGAVALAQWPFEGLHEPPRAVEQDGLRGVRPEETRLALDAHRSLRRGERVPTERAAGRAHDLASLRGLRQRVTRKR